MITLETALDLPLPMTLAAMQRGIMERTTYFGIRTLKNPLDAWVYQEIITETRPDVIVEIGTGYGGTTLMLAHLCDLLVGGKVISVDTSHGTDVPVIVRKHPRIMLVHGDACSRVVEVARLIRDRSALVIEDSSHTYDNTLAVLRAYSRFIKPGGYFIVEDTICHHGLDVGPTPGPFEAVETFLKENPNFVTDREREHFLVTWNPRGYLRRI